VESAARKPAAPGDYGFDLDRTLSSVVGLHSIIPPDASAQRRSAPNAPAMAW
jgi:hypothetical protein